MIPSEVQPKPEEALHVTSSPLPATSVLGQASLIDTGAKPNPDDDLEIELKHLCKDTADDPFAPIIEETVDDKSIPLMEGDWFLFLPGRCFLTPDFQFRLSPSRPPDHLPSPHGSQRP